MNPIYQLSGVLVNVKGIEILHIPELVFRPGEFVAVGGPNGAGKSTLLAVLSGLREEFAGRCLFQGCDVRQWSRKELCGQVAFVNQSRSTSFPYTVEEIVLMGRMPHARGWFEIDEDLEILDTSLTLAGAADLRGREFRTLSGGEQQRVILASALAQQPKVLLLDEPTNHLDLYYQVQFFQLLGQLRNNGILVISVTHDFNMAASHADRLVVLQSGRLVADGRPEVVITGDLMREVFRVSPEFWRNGAGKLWMRYEA